MAAGEPGCPFCRMFAGLEPYRDVGWWPEVGVMAIEQLNPVTTGHTLIIPSRHVRDATTDPALTATVMECAALYARRHDAANIITSIGGDATQAVWHLHVHVVPREPGDGLALPWDVPGPCRWCGG